MRDFTDELTSLHARLDAARAYLRLEAGRARMEELEGQMQAPGFWDDPEAARIVSTEHAGLAADGELVQTLDGQLSDAETLAELAREEADDSLEGEIVQSLDTLSRRLDDLELRALFTGEYDERDAICTVNSGAGGTDAQDWTNMLLRMYIRWAERRGFGVELDEVSPGTEAGISSATFTIKGRYAYGLLTGERGVHRLIRISPFDANAWRQTAFASFDAVPELDEAE